MSLMWCCRMTIAGPHWTAVTCSRNLGCDDHGCDAGVFKYSCSDHPDPTFSLLRRLVQIASTDRTFEDISAQDDFEQHEDAFDHHYCNERGDGQDNQLAG
jgi:hypothetical protein